MAASRLGGTGTQGRGPSGGGVGTGTSRPNGIRRGLGSGGRRRSPNEWAENRPPAQSNHRAEREGSGHQKRNEHRHRTPGGKIGSPAPSSGPSGASPCRG